MSTLYGKVSRNVWALLSPTPEGTSMRLFERKSDARRAQKFDNGPGTIIRFDVMRNSFRKEDIDW